MFKVQEGKGFVFHMSVKRMNRFSILDVLGWYVKSLDLKVSDYLFPRLRGAGRGKTVLNVNLYVGYNASVMVLKRFCLTNGIPMLILHSGQRGMAMVGM